MDSKNKMTEGKAFVILIASAAVILLGALVIKSPTVVNLLFAGLVASFLAMFWGIKWESIQEDILEFAKRMFPAILILIFVGMMVGAWIQCGTVPYLIYWGLKLLSPKFFLVATALICSIMSIATGTSWGTVATVGIALMGVATGLGVSASRRLKFHSSRPGIARVSGSGRVTARRCGNTTITVKTYNGRKAKLQLTVVK